MELNLSIAALAEACKGDVSQLPVLWVHDTPSWPGPPRVDSENRIHMSRATFRDVVRLALPTRPGMWVRRDTQAFTIDLQPHHLQGGEDTHADTGRDVGRMVTQVDAAGRIPGEEGYGTVARPADRFTATDLDAARVAAGGELRGVGVSLRADDDDTERGLPVED